MNAPAVFQCFINKVLQEILKHYMFIFIGDIVTYSHSMDEPVVNFCWVLQLVLENNLHVKLENSFMHMRCSPWFWFLPFMPHVIAGSPADTAGQWDIAGTQLDTFWTQTLSEPSGETMQLVWEHQKPLLRGYYNNPASC
ncbi:hypothetical protein MHYP_G00104700 [Metynnis hypsauchen]